MNGFKKKILASIMAGTLFLSNIGEAIAGCCGEVAAIGAQTEAILAYFEARLLPVITASQAVSSKTESQMNARIAEEAHKATIIKDVNIETAKKELEFAEKFQQPGQSAKRTAEAADLMEQGELDSQAQRNKFSTSLLHRKLNNDSNVVEKNKSYALAKKLYAADGNMPYGDISVDSILTGAGQSGKVEDLTFNKAQIYAGGRYIMNAISTSIPEPLPSDVISKTNSGRDFEMIRKELLAKLSLSQKIHADALAYRTPINGLNGLSPASFMSKQINARYGNRDWLVELETQSELRLLKENLYMQAINLKLQQQQIEHLEKISLALAQILDSQNNNSDAIARLNILREQALKEKK